MHQLPPKHQLGYRSWRGSNPGSNQLALPLQTEDPLPLLSGTWQEEVSMSQCRMQYRHHWRVLTFFTSQLRLAHKKPTNVINSSLKNMVLINYWVIQGDWCVKHNALLNWIARNPSWWAACALLWRLAENFCLSFKGLGLKYKYDFSIKRAHSFGWGNKRLSLIFLTADLTGFLSRSGISYTHIYIF